MLISKGCGRAIYGKGIEIVTQLKDACRRNISPGVEKIGKDDS